MTNVILCSATFFFLIYLFMAVLCLRFCARALSSRGKQGPLLIGVRGPLTIAASPAVEHRLQTHRPSNCGSRAQLLRGTRDPPRPGLEPASPTLAGGLSTTAPPGKPCSATFYLYMNGHKGQSPENRLSCIFQAIGNILLQKVRSQHD